jgi:hypothetical protein
MITKFRSLGADRSGGGGDFASIEGRTLVGNKRAANHYMRDSSSAPIDSPSSWQHAALASVRQERSWRVSV